MSGVIFLMRKARKEKNVISFFYAHNPMGFLVPLAPLMPLTLCFPSDANSMYHAFSARPFSEATTKANKSGGKILPSQLARDT